MLPLAYLNKSKLPTEEVTPSTNKENPVKEAERSIELEKLIAHTMMIIDASTRRSNTDDISEEPVEIPVENLPEDPMILTDDSDESSALESLPTATEQNILSENVTEQVSVPADTSETSETQDVPLVVKAEPAQVLNDMLNTDVICLDSDEEPGATEEAPVTSDDLVLSVVEEGAQTASAEVSRSSVSNEVTITKVKKEAPAESEPKQNENNQTDNVIDLSDDEPGPATAPESAQIVEKRAIFKCPCCSQVHKSAVQLRRHVNKPCPRRAGPLRCPHLPCAFDTPTFSRLLDHYHRVHSADPKRTLLYECGICGVPFTSTTGAKLHIRSVHKVLNYAVAAAVDANGREKFVIGDAGGAKEPVRISGRKTSVEVRRYQAEPGGGRPRRASAERRRRYGVDDIDKLPISPILDSQVHCELCDFGTKVRLNMVRHLQQHAGDTPVPRTAPVNPVPHLETNEMHFDRMVNLASSSAAARPAERARYPRHVPERLRYACGARACDYISVDPAMFRRHWATLHAAEAEYRCGHCPPHQALAAAAPLTAARILGHLRMHDASLYACSACAYYHYKRAFVERHAAEAHAAAAVRAVREPARPEPPPPAPAPTMDLKPWRCGLCDYSSMLRPKVLAHCAADHQSKMQFKCGHCMFRSSARENVVKHRANAHPTLPEDVFYYFYREGSLPDEDGVPRWQSQRRKLRLDERDVKTEPEPEPGPQTPETTITPTSITVAPIHIDLNIVKEEKLEEPRPDTELSGEDLRKKFGDFCEPDGIKYKCCLCNAVREHSRETMQCHLFEELNYRRYVPNDYIIVHCSRSGIVYVLYYKKNNICQINNITN